MLSALPPIFRYSSMVSSTKEFRHPSLMNTGPLSAAFLAFFGCLSNCSPDMVDLFIASFSLLRA